MLVGLAVAGLVRLMRSRVDDLLVENTLSIVTPFAAYPAAEHIHASGVLAVVVTGLVLGHLSPTLVSGPSRLQTRAVWRLVAFLVEGAVFAVIGLQLPEVVVRPLWVFPTAYAGQRLMSRGRDQLPWQIPAAVSWAGMRGVISLAMASAPARRAPERGAVPAPEPARVPDLRGDLRDAARSGLTFGPVLRALALGANRQQLVLEQANAQQQATGAALARLEELVASDPPEHEAVVEQLRHFARRRADGAWERLAEHRDAGETPSATYRRLRGEMLRVERQTLVELRDRGRLSDESLRELERQLDFEEAQLTRG